MSNEPIDFDKAFKTLTGNDPLSWQRRLFHEYFAKGAIPPIIDLPTGMGKTMVMAIWLIARMQKDSPLPRRLIYVVDRRTVVDQATDLAVMLQKGDGKNLKGVGDHRLAISTLRGQLADNREWSRDPSKLAIIIGTVDLIGSALLFSGYRSSYKERPLHAGLLGQDSLLVLDEAHLSKPFEKLVTSISQFQSGRGLPMKVVRMSATSGEPSKERPTFVLDIDPNSPTHDLKPDPDSETGDERNPIITRFGANKCLKIAEPTDPTRLNSALAKAAIKLATDTSFVGKRIVVFVHSPGDAKAIADAIIEHEKPNKSKSNTDPKGPFGDSVEVLTGTLRGFERDRLVLKPVFKDRWFNGSLDPSAESNQKPVFLISTSAGEVGFDLNADHMVSDQTTIDSFIQRLGRVNRRGTGNATIVLIPKVMGRIDKDGKPRKLSDFDKAIVNTLDLVKDQTDVSPSAIARLKSSQWKEKYAPACSPAPTMVELTDILLDAWSMTSIKERMPGRPEVAPWLRGVADELPQTTIAWRAELDLFKDSPDPVKAFIAIFSKHRIRSHESLVTSSYRVIEFLKAVTKKRPELRDARAVIKFSRDLIVKTIGELIDNPGPLNADPTLILPATFGGLERTGMVSDEAIPPSSKPGDQSSPSLDVADEDGYESRKDARSRIRILIKRTDDGWEPLPLPGGKPLPADLNLQSSYDTSTLLFQPFAAASFRVRLVQPVTFDDEGDPVQSLVLFSPVGEKSKKLEQSLAEHVHAVEVEAERIAKELGLEEPFRTALIFAAKWHDEGKGADIWQRFIGGPDKNGQPLGKSATPRNPKLLRGYRHEFGSLVRMLHSERHATGCTLPTDIDSRELALHLIGTHHGSGTPHFANPFDHDFTTVQCETAHIDSIRRFGRLRRKYGHWRLAWLENLLRCADGIASAAITGSTNDQEDDAEEAES